MAYVGSTAASTVANPPHRIDHGGLSARSIQESTTNFQGRGLWFYNSSAPTTEVQVANYFSDADRLGMRNGDVVIVVQCTDGTTTAVTPPRLLIGALSAVTSAGGTLAATGHITST
jgi:hypothetical protein